MSVYIGNNNTPVPDPVAARAQAAPVQQPGGGIAGPEFPLGPPPVIPPPIRPGQGGPKVEGVDDLIS